MHYELGEFLWQEYKKITAFITACKYGCLINEYEISNKKKKIRIKQELK